MNQVKVLSFLGKFRPKFPKVPGSTSLSTAQERPSSRHIAEESDYLYKAGGFHRVSLGDRFASDRYTILRKLGYGQYSTVWLARDSKAKKYVALKILRADCYGGAKDIFEQEILSRISDVSRRSNHEGRHYVLSTLDQFKHNGPNGEHVCFVFDVMGYHLGFQSAKYEGGKMPVTSVKSVVRQLLLGLDFLHRECGIIHTDLKPTNILMELQNPDETISQYLSEVPPRIDSQGMPLREAIRTPLLSNLSEPHIRIIDFGVASWKDRHLSELIQSPALRAPEVTIGAPWESSVDIWSLGCLIVEFIQGIVLFSGEPSKNGSWTADDDRLAKMIEVLGPFPSQLLKRGKRTADFFNKRGDLLRIQQLKPTTLERLINGTTKPFLKPNDMPDAEVPIFLNFLTAMLSIDPNRRRSAADLLQHDWIKV
ncbi:protein kinase, putative [Talaromyces stipitatus ATCC 10500]|uniref:non-specific serine/threonine protein kinase n=1 Tax=Talaromyces stipitatus (strain ATCC 10500 / CBS 375.48 / QM 6759 / NRRL 1006) TaxID=441959 RepID=B8M8H7_TALSN|nr:protein kinase, putative [Talaromyces stipitatus ATCC 10500]EED20490.1 protein kinase, putative [Talaromyces stipitatus ATCC 10500]